MFLRKWILHDLETRYKISDEMFQNEKKKVRIAVIDNEQVDNMANNLRAAGYGDVTPLKNILQFDDIKNFDIILLDIKGIGLKLLKGTTSASQEGLSIAREIKRLYPQKKVIVFSAMLKDYEDHFVLHGIVDAKFVKDGDISERNKTIDACIRDRIDPVCAWKKNRALLLENGVSIYAVAELESEVVRSILKKRAISPATIEKLIGNAVALAKIIASIAELVALAIP